MRIVFAGTPEFAVPPLEALLGSQHEICAVYTQPDRPAGRGRKLKASPVKQLAERHAIPVFQPQNLRGPVEQAQLGALQADLMIVVAYGQILPQAVINLPRLGCLNIHASLLPRWRGAAPIQRALLAGDAEAGVTLMFIEPRLDAGPMLSRKRFPIEAGETAGALHDRLARLGAEALMEALPALEAGSIEAETQDESEVTYADKISKEEARIDWGRPAIELERQVRAFNPWPVAETSFRGEALRVWAAEILTETAEAAPGSVLAARDTLDVATGSGVLRLHEIQLPGGRRISARDFLNAHRGEIDRFG